jgi:antitoxin PrlF
MRAVLFVGKPRKNESLTRESQSITFFVTGITESELATNVTVKGQVTLPKAVREAANIRPGDRVNVRVRPEGGVIIEAEAAMKTAEAYLSQLEEMSRRQPIRGFSTEEIMRMTRGED